MRTHSGFTDKTARRHAALTIVGVRLVRRTRKRSLARRLVIGDAVGQLMTVAGDAYAFGLADEGDSLAHAAEMLSHSM